MEVTVRAIGAQGDGIAGTPEARLYIPFAAPGDHLRVRPGAPRGDGRAAAIEAILDPGPDRIAPTCRHFGDCGGCALQHLAPAAIAEVKRELLRAALARRGFHDLLVELDGKRRAGNAAARALRLPPRHAGGPRLQPA